MKVYPKWSDDLNQTQPALEILATILYKKGEGELISIEKTDNTILMWLDKYSGIDWIGKTQDNNLISFAGRIQWDHYWGTFTIRYKRNTNTKTEFEKRCEAIQNGFMYPTYTLQAYFTRDYKFLGGAYIKTIDLYDSFIKNGYKTRESDNIFIYKTFDEIQNEGYKVYKLEPKEFKFVTSKQFTYSQN